MIKSYMRFILAAIVVLSARTTWANVVEVVWPWSISSTTTNYVRVMLDQANQSQKDFRFILVHKPGAGGTIAANHVRNSRSLSLLVSSNAFFVRPYLYPNQSYDFKDFQPVMTMGQMPLAIIGKAGTSWDTVGKKSQIMIGIPGLGTFSHVVAQRIADVYPQVILVPYPGTTEALKDVGAGIIDLSIDVPAMALAAPESYQILFITGSNNFANKFLLAGQSMTSTFYRLNLEFAVLASADVDNKTVARLRDILQTAHNNPKLQSTYQQDMVTAITGPVDLWYRNNINHYKSLTQNIKVPQ